MENKYKNYETLLKKKFSAYDWSISDPEDYDTLVWNQEGVDKPTKEFLDSKLEAAARNYKARRAEFYPSLQDQLDMLWHGMDSDQTKRIEPFYSSIKIVKDTFPKVI